MYETPTSLVYTGDELKVPCVVHDGDTLLTEGTDYEVTYPYGTTSAGTTKVTIVGKGNYTDAIYSSFDIAKASLTATYAGETIDVTEEPQYAITYSGFVNGETAQKAFESGTQPVVEASGFAGDVGEYDVVFTNEGFAKNYKIVCEASGKLVVVDKATDALAALEELLGSKLTAGSQAQVTAAKDLLGALNDEQRERLENLKAASSLAGKDLDAELAAADKAVGALVEAEARQSAVEDAGNLIARANAAKKGVVTAAKAAAVAYNKKWVSAAHNKALTAAVAALERLTADDASTSAQLQQAAANLDSVLSAYKSAIKQGTKNTGVIKTKSKKLKWSKLAKKAQSFTLAKSGVAEKAKVAWKKVKGSAKVKVNAKTGKVTVAKKAIKKGKTLKVTVSMTMAKTKSCAKTTVKQVVVISAK